MAERSFRCRRFHLHYSEWESSITSKFCLSVLLGKGSVRKQIYKEKWTKILNFIWNTKDYFGSNYTRVYTILHWFIYMNRLYDFPGQGWEGCLWLWKCNTFTAIRELFFPYASKSAAIPGLQARCFSAWLRCSLGCALTHGGPGKDLPASLESQHFCCKKVIKKPFPLLIQRHPCYPPFSVSALGLRIESPQILCIVFQIVAHFPAYDRGQGPEFCTQ